MPVDPATFTSAAKKAKWNIKGPKDCFVIDDNDQVGAFAEFEREMIRERTQAGLKVAKDEGRTGGRKPTLREDQRTDIIENILDGRKTGAQMARLYNVSEATISRVMTAHRQVLARD